MKLDVEHLSTVKKKINVIMPKETVAEKIGNAYDRKRKEAKVKGFRQGKAPRSILEKYYGGQVLDDVLNDILKETYPKVIESEGLEPVSFPEYGKNFSARKIYKR